jgi:hypothetical protein
MVGKSGKSPAGRLHVVKEQVCQGAFAAYPRFAPIFHVLLGTAKGLSYSFHLRSFLIPQSCFLLFRFPPLPIFGHI